jgi:hypothetical protein
MLKNGCYVPEHQNGWEKKNNIIQIESSTLNV